MLIFPPRITVSEYDGFTSSNDLFNRKPFAESLTNLIMRVEDSLVLALDAPWGEGKSTFVQQWRGYLKSEHNIESIYFDAFTSDYTLDPFVALGSELYNFINNKAATGEQKTIWKARKSQFMKASKKWGKIFLKTAANVGIRVATAGVVSGNDLSCAADAAIESVGENIEANVSKFFEEQSCYKKAFNEFHSSLEILANELSKKNEHGKMTPLVFIIDELDRCRPDFALDLIEKVKHVFSVPGILFFLVYNGDQVEQHIKCRYGDNIDASGYLSKFISVTLCLPKRLSMDRFGLAESEIYKYCDYLFNIMKLKDEVPIIKNDDFYQKYISLYACHKDISLRDIEKICTYMALYYSSVREMEFVEQYILIGLIIIRLIRPGMLNRLLSGMITWDEIDNLLMLSTMASSTEAFSRGFINAKNVWRLCIGVDKENDASVFLRQALFRYNIEIGNIIRYHVKKMLEFTPAI